MGKHDVGRRRGLYRRVVVRRRRSSFVVVRRMYVVDVPIIGGEAVSGKVAVAAVRRLLARSGTVVQTCL
jgi:hypothetical protein